MYMKVYFGLRKSWLVKLSRILIFLLFFMFLSNGIKEELLFDKMILKRFLFLERMFSVFGDSIFNFLFLFFF